MSTSINCSLEVAKATTPHSHLHAKVSPRQQRVSGYFRWKGVLDRPLAAIMLIPGLPIIGLLWLLVRAGSAGPGIYRQKRVGLNGRTFYMLKLRSMRQDAEAASGAVWCTKYDPRITRLGALLRKYHLDELPQLVNVLKGEMSLVGPRPERPEFVEVLAQRLDGYRERLSVRPGITGLAQVNLPPDTDLASVARKLVLDLEYIEQANLRLEARLLLCTASKLAKLNTVRLLGLKRTVELAGGTEDGVPCPDTSDTVSAADMAAETVRLPSHKHGSKGRSAENGRSQKLSRPWSPR